MLFKKNFVILLAVLGICSMTATISCSSKKSPGVNNTPQISDDTDDSGDDYQPDEITAPACDGNCYYVRSGATGSNNGLDWNNAYTELPAQLERSGIYYIAKGDYSKQTFDDDPDGDEYIYILKATESDHGTDVGWVAGYGNNSARFRSLQFNKSYYIMDGQSDGGFEIVGDYQSAVVQIVADNVTVRNCNLNGNFTTNSSGYHIDGACLGLSIYANYVTIRDCDIHDAADDGLEMHGGNHLAFINNRIHDLHACGTDGECGPCYNGHSDGMEIYNVKDSLFSGNFIYDNGGTNAALFFGNWAGSSAEYCENITLTNNIFYMPVAGFVAYFIDVAGLKVYNNTFWGIARGRYGGLCMGQNVTDLDMYNNIILSVDYHHLNVTYDPANHRGNYNLFGVALGYYQEQGNDIVNNNPAFLSIPDANGDEVNAPSDQYFKLKSTSPCVDKGYSGNSTINIPSTDYYGKVRPNSGANDIGASEFY